MENRLISVACRVPLQLCVMLLACGLAACGVPGHGVAPDALQITTATGISTSNGVARVFVCFASPLTAMLDFTDGSSADYTGRVVWSSSKPGVAQVSNDDILQPNTTVDYNYGTIIPRSPGTTTISANFEGLVKTLEVSVGGPTDFTVLREDQNLPTPITALTVGLSTTANLKVDATLDSVVKDVSAFAFWITENSGLASIDSTTGALTGRSIGGPTAVEATFPLCGENASVPVTVANVDQIEIDPEFGTDPLIVGNNEKMNVMADLSDGTQQDVSLQAVLTSEEPDVANFAPLVATTDANILTASQAGAVEVMATLNNMYTAAPVTLNLINASLQSIAVSPTSATLTAGSSTIVPFTALGTYDNGQTQDVTRVVSWGSSNVAVATVGSTPINGGQAISASAQSALVTITATGANAGVLASANLAVNAAP